ncbi:2,4-dihydroxyhept-2-ene-1,7-dioic acid aldolase [Phaeobacter gallaeciensis]|uniref:2,4-dihydroxyhept-2-ene-1,7-dioic acid aldolase n=2 Tax=Roseobacteraceae TaxID=2854170 RepID=A0A366WQP2_9RHOB|nr:MULTISPECIES: aldolase/citrate lyase family protein [Roseobacteraceae]MBT3143129.1 2,4-dihydroxyhept-2-ene-1,7-dioic acid aldolase [Falsiruegeria litorea]MBT8171221.1 2,4-dihydroxyhept-2-ene-1,7-dioic acid aldolase [Falsiruegeria litorea]RBW51663.1 2,4-dihydroxyhept-2-ene-1,7-dioic acid aldolase [Phaeobacter gallaeciensis]
MRPNKIREHWAAGRPVVNGWLSIPSGFSAETMAHQGWDTLTVDIQHGLIDYQKAVEMFTAISTTDTVPVTRVPWLEPGILMKVLDAGAYGVICPMINSREDAENLVAWTHYPPEGTRSFGPIRGLLYGGPDYPEHANNTIVVFAMIETLQGLDNLEEILSVPGLDAVYIGPSDLSLALGCRPAFDDVEPPVAEAIEMIAAKAKEYGKFAGCHNGTPEYALKRIEMGFQFVTIASDARLMAAASKDALAQVRDGLT